MRWDKIRQRSRDTPRADAFLVALAELCRTHRIAISHEDTQGSFVLVVYDEGTMDWMREAMVHGVEDKSDIWVNSGRGSQRRRSEGVS